MDYFKIPSLVSSHCEFFKNDATIEMCNRDVNLLFFNTLFCLNLCLFFMKKPMI